jgi:hypothetical protein
MAVYVLAGVISVGITGDGKDRLEVVGDNVDSVCLASCLRRKLGHAEIMQVEEVKDKKPEDKKPEEPKAVVHQQPYFYYPPPPPMVLCEEQNNCTVM